MAICAFGRTFREEGAKWDSLKKIRLRRIFLLVLFLFLYIFC
jgi:hypothetical protein